MRPSTSWLRPPLALLLLLIATTAASPLEETCHAISVSRSDLSSSLCISSLAADPGSRSADRHGLALIATRLSIINATNTANTIQNLLDAGPEPKTADCLSVCFDVYSDAADHLRDAATSLNSGKYKDAVTFLSAALDAAANCEDAFGDDGITSPMAEEDSGYERLAKIALAIAATLGC